jgi:hypothetical protein
MHDLLDDDSQPDNDDIQPRKLPGVKESEGNPLYLPETIKVVGKGEEIMKKMLENERRAVLEAPLVVA